MNKMITNMIFCVLRWTWSFVFIFVFVFVLVCIYVMCFCAATDFSVNKDLYIRRCRLSSLRRHHPPPSDTRIVLLDIKGGVGSVSRSRSLSDRDALGKLGIQSRRSAARIIFQLDQQPIHRNPLPLPPPTHRRRAGSLRKTAFEYSNNQIRVYVFIVIRLYSLFCL